MASENVIISVDESELHEFEKICQSAGLSVDEAFTLFIRKVIEDGHFPFDISNDPFYSSTNMEYLSRVIADIDSGKANLIEHGILDEA